MFQGLLVTKKALEKIGYLDEKIVSYQEWDTAIRLAKHFSFGFVPESTYLYDCRGNDTISKQLIRQGVGIEQIIKKHVLAMFWIAGPYAVIAHYETAARWYAMGQDQKSERRCKRLAGWYKLLRPSSYYHRPHAV